MDLLIDTSLLIAVERSGSRPESLIESAGNRRLHLAAITASELLHGVHRADSALRRSRRQRFVEAVLDALPVLPFDLETARVHAQIWADLTRKGEPIGPHDLQIAATALHHGLSLATANEREFRRLPGLTLEVWQ